MLSWSFGSPGPDNLSRIFQIHIWSSASQPPLVPPRCLTPRAAQVGDRHDDDKLRAVLIQLSHVEEAAAKLILSPPGANGKDPPTLSPKLGRIQRKAFKYLNGENEKPLQPSAAKENQFVRDSLLAL